MYEYHQKATTCLQNFIETVIWYSFLVFNFSLKFVNWKLEIL